MGLFSLPFLTSLLSIDRRTRRYLVLPRPIIIAHIEPDDVPAKVRLSTFVPVKHSCPSPLPFSLLFARGSRGRTTEAKAPQRSAEASKMAVCDASASVGSLFWPLCVSRNGNGLLTWWGWCRRTRKHRARAAATSGLRAQLAQQLRRPLGLRGG